jgi:carbonic anhydrase/acetyltransferase-like protein (isoleucine patch superfamily)
MEFNPILPELVLRGARSNVQDGAVIHARGVFNEAKPGRGYPTIIGEDVSLGHKAMVHGCEIQDKCLIGINAVVLDGVLIKPYTLVAAGSVVTPGKVLESGLWAGTPARRIRDLTNDELSMLEENAANYVELKEVWEKYIGNLV